MTNMLNIRINININCINFKNLNNEQNVSGVIRFIFILKVATFAI